MTFLPAREPGGKDTRIAITTVSVLTAAMRRIAGGQGEYELCDYD